MEIKRVFVGGWFQRTRLHLGEIYDFLREADSPLALDPKKLDELRSDLTIESLDLKVKRLEYIELRAADDVVVEIYEDGLITLTTRHSHDLSADIARLTAYYEERLSPAFSYIFSLGAPVPKELADIKTVYPYFVSVSDATEDRIDELFGEFDQSRYYTVTHQRYDVYRGDKLYIINQHGVSDESVARFVGEQIFVREFRGQLHRYLNLHRIIWEKIAAVKERGELKGKEIPAFKTQVAQYKKTINFIGTRIDQMGTYLSTRERIADSDPLLADFQEVLGYKHETLGDTLSYIKDIWGLTQKYVDSALSLFSDLQSESTDASVQNLTVVTSMGVGASLLGLFTADSVPEFTLFGVGYFFALAGIGYTVNRLMKWWYKRRTYEVSDVELAKDIR